MQRFRYLACLGGAVCIQAGTLDELHQRILARRKHTGFKTTFQEIDTWTEPGELVSWNLGLAWRPAA